MEATVGTSPFDLAASEAKLRDPNNPTYNINNFHSIHISAHATAAANLQPSKSLKSSPYAIFTVNGSTYG